MPTIWWANAIATGASYGYAYTFQSGKGEDEDDDETLPAPLKAALKVRVWQHGLCVKRITYAKEHAARAVADLLECWVVSDVCRRWTGALVARGALGEGTAPHRRRAASSRRAGQGTATHHMSMACICT